MIITRRGGVLNLGLSSRSKFPKVCVDNYLKRTKWMMGMSRSAGLWDRRPRTEVGKTKDNVSAV